MHLNSPDIYTKNPNFQEAEPSLGGGEFGLMVRDVAQHLTRLTAHSLGEGNPYLYEGTYSSGEAHRRDLMQQSIKLLPEEFQIVGFELEERIPVKGRGFSIPEKIVRVITVADKQIEEALIAPPQDDQAWFFGGDDPRPLMGVAALWGETRKERENPLRQKIKGNTIWVNAIRVMAVLTGASLVTSCLPGQEVQSYSTPTENRPGEHQPLPSSIVQEVSPTNPEAQATFAPELPATPLGQEFAPAVNPPEFSNEGRGGPIVGLSNEEIVEMKNQQWFRVYKQMYNVEGQEVLWNNAEEFEAEMKKLAESRPELTINQNQSADGSAVITYIHNTATNSILWGFTNEGAVAFAEPHLTIQETRLGEVPLPQGLTPEFRYNTQDKHWYLFGVNAQGQGVMVFIADGATRDNLHDQWRFAPGVAVAGSEGKLGVIEGQVFEMSEGAMRALGALPTAWQEGMSIRQEEGGVVITGSDGNVMYRLENGAWVGASPYTFRDGYVVTTVNGQEVVLNPEAPVDANGYIQTDKGVVVTKDGNAVALLNPETNEMTITENGMLRVENQWFLYSKATNEWVLLPVEGSLKDSQIINRQGKLTVMGKHSWIPGEFEPVVVMDGNSGQIFTVKDYVYTNGESLYMYEKRFRNWLEFPPEMAKEAYFQETITNLGRWLNGETTIADEDKFMGRTGPIPFTVFENPFAMTGIWRLYGVFLGMLPYRDKLAMVVGLEGKDGSRHFTVTLPVQDNEGAARFTLEFRPRNNPNPTTGATQVVPMESAKIFRMTQPFMNKPVHLYIHKLMPDEKYKVAPYCGADEMKSALEMIPSVQNMNGPFVDIDLNNLDDVTLACSVYLSVAFEVLAE